MDRDSFDPDGISDSLLTAAVSLHGVDTAGITLSGDLDRSSAPQLADAVQHALVSGPLRVVALDLAGVDFLDVGGVRAVAEARAHCVAAGCRLRLENPPPFVQRVLEVTGEWPIGEPVLTGESHAPTSRADQGGRMTGLVPGAEVLRSFAAHAESWGATGVAGTRPPRS